MESNNLKNAPRYWVPESLKSAVNLYSSEKETVYMAGGTDLMPLIKNGIRRPSCLIDIEKFDALYGIEKREKNLFIGALTPLAQLAADETVSRLLPALARAAASVASPQIRNVATVGGNLLQEKRCMYFNQSEFWRRNVDPCYRLGGNRCFQMPGASSCMALYYSDLAPVFMAYDARAVMFDGANEIEIPVETVIHRHSLGELGRDILSGILIPHGEGGSTGIFMKYAVRHAIDFALSNVCIRYTPGTKSGDAATLKIMVGAVGPEPVRLLETEQAILKGFKERDLDTEAIYAQAKKEVQSRSAMIREVTVSIKGKRNALLIVLDALRTFLEGPGRSCFAA